MTQSPQHHLASDPALPQVDDVIQGRYRVRRVIGQGGFAVVYEAEDERTRQIVAVKVIDPVMSRRPEIAERFRQEVRTVTRLRHHHTIKVFDAGVTATGCLFLVMERLHGEPLDDALVAAKRMPPDRVKHIAVQVLKSLIEAHEAGIIHRDLKPANIFLVELPGERDYVKVLDFGIAKSLDDGHDTSLTQTGAVVCSPNYVAPERVSKNHTTPGSDIYSLGVLMIELLEGRAPYRGDTPMSLMLQHLRLDDPVPMMPSTASGPLGAILERATDKRLDARYQSAKEMLDDLLRVDAAGTVDTISQPVHTSRVPIGMVTHQMDEEPDPSPATSRVGRAAAVLAVLVLLAGAGLTFAVTRSAPADTPSEVQAGALPATVGDTVEPRAETAAPVAEVEPTAPAGDTPAPPDATLLAANDSARRAGASVATETRVVALELLFAHTASRRRDVVATPQAVGTPGTVPIRTGASPTPSRDEREAGDALRELDIAPAPAPEPVVAAPVAPPAADPPPPTEVEPEPVPDEPSTNRFGSTDRPR